MLKNPDFRWARLYLRPALLLAVMLGALTFGARAWGGTQPPHPALVGFSQGCEGKPPGCWYGIVPGVTPLAAAMRALNVAQYANSGRSGLIYLIPPNLPYICVIEFDYDNQIVTALRVKYCEESEVRIGDVATLMGLPEQVQGRRRELIYGGGVSVHTYGWWSPYDATTRIHIRSDEPFSAIWHGFIPKWRFCQLVMKAVGC